MDDLQPAGTWPRPVEEDGTPGSPSPSPSPPGPGSADASGSWPAPSTGGPVGPPPPSPPWLPGWQGMPGGGPPWIQAPDRSRRFRLRAVVGAGAGGLVLGLGLGVVAIVLLAAFADDSFFAPGAVAASHGPVTDDAPQTGDCLRLDPARSDVTGRADVVDCDVDHGSEVIGIATLPDLGRLPDTSDLDYFVDEACRLSFSDYVGGSYDESDLWFGAVVPNDAAWAAGDRTVYCLIESVDFREGRGSARDSS